MAKLFFRYGAMNSGKSTLLMQVAHNYEERGMRVLVMKPHCDTKGGAEVVSRLGVRRSVDCIITESADCRVILHEQLSSGKVDCILVDEAQFLTPAQVDQLFAIAIDDNIPVLCYGLRTDFRGQGFPGSQRLLLLAHALEELKTICHCGRKAVMNVRKLRGQVIFEGEQVAIDGEEQIEYESFCGQCYFQARRSAGFDPLDGLHSLDSPADEATPNE